MNLKFTLGLLGVVLFSLAGNAVPVISSFTPNFGAQNDTTYITITGTGFYPGTLIVKFNGTLAVSLWASSSTEITAGIRVGTPLGTGPVFVSVNDVPAPVNNGVVFTVIGPNDPYVTDFSPTAGVADSTVTLTGVHFVNNSPITAIKFNGVNASFGSVTEDTVTATVPTGATTGPITVHKTGAATFTNAALFYVSPIVTNFAPTSGRAGTNVVIKGTSFLGATAVKFGSLIASFAVDSNSQITAVVPNNAVSGTIRVEAPGGTNITSTSFLVPPLLTSFSPGFGPVGTSVTVLGERLNVGGTPTVKFGGITAATPTGVSSTQLTVLVPSGATNAPISVTTTADGTGTSAQSFYIPATITSFTPTNSLPGSTVKITGNNFSGATAVTFNGAAAASFVVSNNTTIGAIVPGGVSTGPVSVTTPAGTVSSTGLFYGTPVINSFNPTHGATRSSVAISGTNFSGATKVLFNGNNASFTVSNNGLINATVPTNSQTGPITVIAPAGTNSLGTFTIDLTSDLNVGVVDASDPVFVGSNLVYTITIANTGPDNALNVKLTNTLPATVSLKSATASQGTLNTNANPIIATLGTITNGFSFSAIITLTVVPQAVGIITDTASAGSDNSDPNPANNSAINNTTVWPLPFLGIQTLTSNQIKVFWPAPLSNFILLNKTNLLTNSVWSTNLAARVISGTNIFVTETNSGATKFFRLKQ